MSFFPDNIKELSASSSRFTKLEEGKTRLRFLDTPTWGFELWTDGEDGSRQVHRCQLNETFDKELLEASETDPKLFGAAKVYNYDVGEVQVWCFTQKQIINSLKEFSDNEEYGDPLGYDIVIRRSGKGRETKYTIMPNPPKELSKEVAKAAEELVETDQLFIGGSPFVGI